MHKIHKSGINILGDIPLLCHFLCLEDDSCSTDIIEMKHHMASVTRKGTFGHFLHSADQDQPLYDVEKHLYIIKLFK